MPDYPDPIRTAQQDLQAGAREAQYLHKLPPSKLLRLIGASAGKRFESDSVLLKEGSLIEDVYIVLQGLVVVGLYQESSPALWLYVSGRGTIVDACALLDPPVSPVTVRAVTDVAVLAVPRSEFVAVIEEDGKVGYEILRNLCSMMSIINRVTLKEISPQTRGPSRN